MKNKMKVLIIETTPATPHAETGLEIAIKENLAGSEVIYCPIFHLLANMIWRSNINGRNASGKIDSIEDWLRYLTDIVRPYATVDLFSINPIPNYVDESIKQNIFDFLYDSQPFGALVKSNAVQLFNTIDFSSILESNRNECESLAQTAIFSYELSQDLIRRHKPDLVYFFNGRTAGTWPIFLACQKLGVKTLVHERGAAKNKYIVWDHPPQYQQTIKDEINKFARSRTEDVARQSAAVFYYRQKSGRVATFGFNNTSQDHDAEISIQGRSERFAVYFTTSNNEILFMPSQDVTNALGSQDAAVTTLVRVCEEENIQLIIKMHPGTPKSERNEYDKFAHGNQCIVISPESSISSYKLGASAFRNFSYGSTLTWEFLYSGIHCAVLSNTIGRGEAGVVELDSAESIRQYLQSSLSEPDPSFSIKFADFMHNYGEQYDFYRPETLFSGTFDVALSAAT